jgi:hypothetical protein
VQGKVRPCTEVIRELNLMKFSQAISQVNTERTSLYSITRKATDVTELNLVAVRAMTVQVTKPLLYNRVGQM